MAVINLLELKEVVPDVVLNSTLHQGSKSRDEHYSENYGKTPSIKWPLSFSKTSFFPGNLVNNSIASVALVLVIKPLVKRLLVRVNCVSQPVERCLPNRDNVMDDDFGRRHLIFLPTYSREPHSHKRISRWYFV